MSDTSQEAVRAYHARTKHRFEAYAEGSGQLDWDAQQAAFRHYPGAPDPDFGDDGQRLRRGQRALNGGRHG